MKKLLNRKYLALLLALLISAASLAACAPAAQPAPAPAPAQEPAPQAEAAPAPTEAPAPEAEPVELIVFAAASMTETMNAIAELYKAVAPHVSIVLNLDSSGTLKTQIEEGADCDLFISAAQKQMNALDAASDKNTDGLDFVLSDTRVNLLENKVALVVPEGNAANVTSYEDINTDKVKLIALGNSDVPVGQYSQEILENMGVWEAIQPKISFGSNVKEVTSQVSEGAVDCGVVYATDAYSAGLSIVAEPPEGMLATKVVYPAAVMKASTHVEEAAAFLAYLQSAEAAAVFEGVGFSMAK